MMKGNRKKAILINAIGIIAARAVFLEMNPLAIGFFTASYMAGTGGGLALITALIGMSSVMPLTLILKYILTMIIVVVIMEIPSVRKREIALPVRFAIPPLVMGIISIAQAAAGRLSGRYIVLSLLEIIIAYVSVGLFSRGIVFLQQPSNNKMNNEQMVSMAVIVAVVIYAFPDFGGSYIAPVKTIVYFIILYFTYKHGAGQGTITGAVCGLALSFRGEPMADAGLYTMMGMIPAVFRDMGRFTTAVVFMIIAILMGLKSDGQGLNSAETGALLSAVLVFMLIPRSMLHRVDTAGDAGGQQLLAAQNLKKIAMNRMKVFSDSFLKLSKTLNTITKKQAEFKQNEINRIFEDITDRLCKNCKKCGTCWENSFEKTYQATTALFNIAEQNGALHWDDVPEGFKNECVCADEFIAETNRGFEIAKLNNIWNNRIAESREIIAEQLKDVSSVIQDITGDIYQTAQIFSTEEEKVERRLKAERILIKDINVFERKDRRKEIYLKAACKNGRCITTREVASAIGEAMGLRIKASESSKSVISKEYDEFIFTEDTKFKVLTGVARAMKEDISGDNFSTLKLETGEMMIALSDGMGTGQDAGEESETVLSLLDQMIEAGFKAETAIKLINSSMVLKSESQTFSTIDMSIINLFTGTCEFIKIGAAPGFIKRDNWVETISSTTLPVGMFGNVDYDTITKKLYEGDIIIMVTDGVLDSIIDEDKEAFIQKLIMNLNSNNPQEIANRILENALIQSNYVPRDDMTVITAGLWLK